MCICRRPLSDSVSVTVMACSCGDSTACEANHCAQIVGVDTKTKYWKVRVVCAPFPMSPSGGHNTHISQRILLLVTPTVY